ncbi:MFS transporter [Apibacter muscae]|nr:MFS transporter [Apibacter muscae]
MILRFINNKIEKNNPKILSAWIFYDWANSVYSLVITSTIFPIYYSILTTERNTKNYNEYRNVWYDTPIRSIIQIFGQKYEPDALFSYSFTISFIMVVISTFFLSSLADVTGNKKNFLKFFCYLGAFSCIGLFFFIEKSQILYGLFLNITASVGFWGSMVFYNSYLPDIATEDRQDQVSAKGYMLGYLGSMLLLILCLFLIEVVAPEDEKLLYIRICFALTGMWWLGFAQYTFKFLPKNHKQEGIRKKTVIINSFKTFYLLYRRIIKNKNLSFFLLSFYFYSVGVQTIFLIAALFGTNEINLESYKLIISILLIQLIAILGAYLCSQFSKVIGNKVVLIICISIWVVICLGGYLLDKTDPNIEYYYYIAAAMVGLVMGGIQSLSRSTYSKMLPEEDKDITATYFSFYDILEKLAIILGTFISGYLINKTGNMSNSIFAMSLFFFVGLFFMILVKIKK